MHVEVLDLVVWLVSCWPTVLGMKSYSSYSCSREEAKEGNGLTKFNCFFFFFLKTKPPQKLFVIEISKFKHRNTKLTASPPPNQRANPTYVCSQRSATISLKSPETLMHVLSTKAAAEQQALTPFPLEVSTEKAIKLLVLSSYNCIS